MLCCCVLLPSFGRSGVELEGASQLLSNFMVGSFHKFKTVSAADVAVVVEEEEDEAIIACSIAQLQCIIIL